MFLAAAQGFSRTHNGLSDYHRHKGRVEEQSCGEAVKCIAWLYTATTEYYSPCARLRQVVASVIVKDTV
jgi:hypothetical protein